MANFSPQDLKLLSNELGNLCAFMYHEAERVISLLYSITCIYLKNIHYFAQVFLLR